MKNHSIILTAILSLSLLACGTDEMTPPVVNAALAGAGAGEKAVNNFILGGEPGIPIQAAPKYGSYVDGNFVEKKNPTDQKQTPLLQIAGDKDKVYHNINADAKILLAHNAAEVLYLNPTKLETSGAALKDALAKVQGITYTGIANAQWSNSDATGTKTEAIDISQNNNVRYYKDRALIASGAGLAGTYAKTVSLAAAEVVAGTVTIVVDNTGRATITPAGIGNEKGSNTFGWDDSKLLTSEIAAVSDPTKVKVIAKNVWKPETPPVITISSGGEVSNDNATNQAGYKLDTGNYHVLFIGEGADSQVGGLINLTYEIKQAFIPETNGPVKLSGNWRTSSYFTSKITAGFYSLGTATHLAFEGKLKLAFVAHVSPAE